MRACRQQCRRTVYQRRSGDRLFGAGDHIGLVVDLEGQSGQTGRQTGQGKSDKAQWSNIPSRRCGREKKVEQELIIKLTSVGESGLRGVYGNNVRAIQLKYEQTDSHESPVCSINTDDQLKDSTVNWMDGCFPDFTTAEDFLNLLYCHPGRK